ncbi:FAD-dependent oxidoreductase [Cellulomonas sp. Sa3CUA2]|uniref:FAD-dependent oxidoreductase n=1 Tax=Cellulomonas avistercoris TaxID=2762242 RepID=A0ABR8QGQ2_9CELL|nr:FAD-dependent oxidoreductase [Cellulomonas avistercoris]MBD7919601.1 FAD-dependent oxidoreductase [Cellulomonas avistercoris]
MIRTDVDVVVVGGGGAGMSAAISAATSGASVVVLEKCPRVGGTTAMSVGSFTAPSTTYQYRAGVNDSIELFVEDMKRANGAAEERENAALRHLLAQHAGPTFEWVSTLGVQFLGPTPEPPFEKPRMHNVLPNSAAYAAALLRECRRRGVRMVTGARVDALLRNAAGDVVGARVGDVSYLARRGVLLATGDYSASSELKARYASPDAARVPAINPSSTGDGLTLGAAAGGVLVQMDRLMEGLRFPPSSRPDLIKSVPSVPALSKVLRVAVERLPADLLAHVIRGALTSWVGPSTAMYREGAILVDHRGERIASEESEVTMARAVAADPRNTAYMVFDDAVARTFAAWPHPVSTFPGVAYAYVDDYRRYRPDLYHRADTPEGLASSVGMAPLALRSTLEAWNADVDAGSDRRFGRPVPGRGLRTGPFYALGPLNACVTLTDGGLAVDTSMRVIDDAGEPILGLWAAGSTGQGGLQLVNHGLHIAWALTSGRIAGRTIARSADRDDLGPVDVVEPATP